MLLYYLFVKLDRKYFHNFPDIAAKFIDSSHKDHLQLSFFQIQTLSFIKKFISTSALKAISQRVYTFFTTSFVVYNRLSKDSNIKYLCN